MREILLIFGGDGDDQQDQVCYLWVEVDIINGNDGDDDDDDDDHDDNDDGDEDDKDSMEGRVQQTEVRPPFGLLEHPLRQM